MTDTRTTDLAEVHDHDRGLAHDMERLRVLNRRRALGLFGVAGSTLALAACGGDDVIASASGNSATATPTPTPTPTPSTSSGSATGSGACVSYASETNGPYPADGTNQSNGSTSNVLTNSSFVRSDVRASMLSSTNTAAGIELTFTITLADVNNDCGALEGYAIYMWHCDADGKYSLYDLPSEDYLRGIQVTDANGQVTFTTIIPGTYNGRYPHIHFEVFSSLSNATGGRYAVLISQFAIPKDQLTSIYAGDTRYTGSINALNNTSLSGDNVFGDNTSDQQDAMMVDLSADGDGTYTATATVGIAT